jgi:hypothetical protein
MTPIPPADPPADISADEAVRRRRLLGVGLRADPVDRRDLARDVSLRRTSGGVDLDIVDGLEALAQDLAVGLTTLRGSDPFNVRFGFLGLGPLAEQTSPAITREALRSAVAQVVGADARVRRITELAATTPTTRVRNLSVRVAFETVSGDPAVMAVSGLASGATFGLESPS